MGTRNKVPKGKFARWIVVPALTILLLGIAMLTMMKEKYLLFLAVVFLGSLILVGISEFLKKK